MTCLSSSFHNYLKGKIQYEFKTSTTSCHSYQQFTCILHLYVYMCPTQMVVCLVAFDNHLLITLANNFMLFLKIKIQRTEEIHYQQSQTCYYNSSSTGRSLTMLPYLNLVCMLVSLLMNFAVDLPTPKIP